jgi:hypothetical protein
VIESLKYLMALVALPPGMWVGDGEWGLTLFVGLGLNFLVDLVVELGLFSVGMTFCCWLLAVDE